MAARRAGDVTGGRASVQVPGARLWGAGVLAGVLAAGLLSAQVIDRVLATVDRQVITLSDVRLALALGLVEARGPDEALARLVDRALMLHEVARYAPPDPGADEVDRALSRVVERVGTEGLARALREAGIDEAGLRERLRQDLLIEAYLAQRFAVVNPPTDEEVAQYVVTRGAELVDSAGRPLDTGRATDLARTRLIEARRQRLLAQWIEQLRARATITYSPAATSRP